jgi:tripartite-type tricarboxylate transporter receptor subunit TctC
MPKLIEAFVALGLLTAPVTVLAADFPDKAVTLVIPQSPGSSSDILGRYAADRLSKLWGKSVVIENRPGAEGVIGSARVVNAKADGYTLLVNSTSLGVNAALSENMPFDPLKDLEPVATLAAGDFVMLTGSRVSLPTLKDLAEKSKTQKIFAANTGGVGELVMRLFAREANIKFEWVQYKSPPEALLDLGGGRVDLFVTSLTTYLASATVDKSTVVAVTSSARAPELPNVPTAIEAGYPGVVATTWWGILAPKGTPTDVATKINADVAKVMQDDAAVAFLKSSRTRPLIMNLGDTTKFVRSDIQRSLDILKDHKK